MSFVRLENLNDFIQPSTSCIKPAENKRVGTVTKVSEISLSDCLACSGCITSAETILVQRQNYDELFKVINDNKQQKNPKTIVVSLSLQAISSLATRYSVTPQECAEKLASFFVSIGCDKVYDINLARHLALIESYKEFKRRHTGDTKTPIISSVCPGWICYAEKTNGELIIPYLSKVRSPQQIMGALLKKHHGASANNEQTSNIYHVTLMPCFDKKLEASRPDFKNSDGSQDVDCVLTPIEFEEIIAYEEVSLNDFEPRKLDILEHVGLMFDNPLTSHNGSASGGYAENILLAAASERLGKSQHELASKIKYNSLKNSDFIELSLITGDESSENSTMEKRVAIVNGFRNIQTIVQRLKRRALNYDYIEIMACPSGCINGGAQCKGANELKQNTNVESTKMIYNSLPKIDIDTTWSTVNQSIFSKLKLGTDDTDDSRLPLYTDFKPIPKTQSLTVNW